MQETTRQAAAAAIMSLAFINHVFATDPLYRIKPWDEVSDHQLSPVGKQLQQADKERWLYAESLHVIGFAYSVRDLDVLLRQAEYAYDEINRYLGLSSGPPKTHVFMVQDERLWNSLMRGAGFRPDGLAFHYQNEIFLKDDAGQIARPDRVPHELVHDRMARAYGRDLPLWLDEGLASYLGWRVAESAARLQSRNLSRTLPAMDRSRVMNFGDLSAVNVYPDDPMTAQVYYREVEELVAAVGEQLGDERMRDFVQAICRDRMDLRVALKTRFGFSDENMEKLEETVIERTTSERSL